MTFIDLFLYFAIAVLSFAGGVVAGSWRTCRMINRLSSTQPGEEDEHFRYHCRRTKDVER